MDSVAVADTASKVRTEQIVLIVCIVRNVFTLLSVVYQRQHMTSSVLSVLSLLSVLCQLL